jgi:hypothetical protein
LSHYHALVWIDHSEAHVIHVSPDDVEKSVIQPKQPHHKLHSRVGTTGSGRAPEDQGYYHQVVQALAGATEILVVGPAQAKLMSKIVGVETVDHPTDGQLVSYALKYFRVKDLML